MPLHTVRELSVQELRRMERLVEAASGGPWLSYVAGRDANVDASYIELGVCNELGSFRSLALVGGTAADQDFIASARQDMPRLILEVRTLRARLGAQLAAQRTIERPTSVAAPESAGPLASAST